MREQATRAPPRRQSSGCPAWNTACNQCPCFSSRASTPAIHSLILPCNGWVLHPVSYCLLARQAPALSSRREGAWGHPPTCATAAAANIPWLLHAWLSTSSHAYSEPWSLLPAPRSRRWPYRRDGVAECNENIEGQRHWGVLWINTREQAEPRACWRTCSRTCPRRMLGHAKPSTNGAARAPPLPPARQQTAAQPPRPAADPTLYCSACPKLTLSWVSEAPASHAVCLCRMLPLLVTTLECQRLPSTLSAATASIMCVA